MTAKPRIQLCAECINDGGWHYPDDAEPFRPHHESLTTLRQAHALTEAAHAEQTKRAREIVRHAAEHLAEFSSNNIRDQFTAAQIDGPIIGAAFAWARDQGLIERCGYEPSTEASTRHPVARWRSIAPSPSAVAS